MTYSFAQALDMFPEAAPAARRAAKSKIKELKSAIGGLHDFRELWTRDIQKINFKLQPAYIAYLDDLISRLHEGYEKEIKKYTWELTYLDNLRGTKEGVARGNAVTALDVERARGYPIGNLLKIQGGQAMCPFHDDHKPSLKIYRDNHAYCFACGQRADSIDVYMQLSGADFKTAVRYLAP